MFNLLITPAPAAWEGPPWAMPVGRFKEFSGSEADGIRLDQPPTLKALEEVPALVAHEWGDSGIEADVVRYGYLHGIEMVGTSLQFNFREEAHCDLDLIDEFAVALSLHEWERTRTHWAIKDGDIPAEMRKQMIPGPYRQFRYEVVLSYAGEDHAYVERVARFLSEREVKFFFAPFREADLWGKELTEELDIIYRREGRYCVTFLSEHYARKAWPTHERRSAMSRAVQEQGRYILPCRFDNTEMPGLRPSISYVDLNSKSPEQLGDLIIQVLRRRRA